MNAKYLLFIGLCILNPSLQKTGMGLQKWSINKMSEAPGKREKYGWMGVWILGLLFQFLTVPFTFIALTLGNASTLGAFGGSGLIVLALFSRFIIKETIVRRELGGIALIIAGTGVLGYFSQEVQSPDVHLSTARTLGFFGAYAVFLFLAVALLKMDLRRFGGVVFGILSGSMGGIGIVMQKVVTSIVTGLHKDAETGGNLMGIGLVLAASPYFWIMVIGGAGGVVLAQFGYKYGKAVQVVPGFASTIVTVPVIAGVVILGEVVPMLCWIGVLIVTLGVLVTTTASSH